ncbi:ferredoxin [Neobacillus niacini]|uniref:4Fe-4S dicluster domain-containing protein n=1 Tax=Neobacillus niacini TaxID=86668 RepID=UPI0028629F52|nr:4Fe-4S dicluster domain-containing protein [Neobacillus niacini]MDR7076643.1 ferredoxin [Neobacillus niacini]
MGLLSKWVESLDYEYEILTSCTHHRSPRSTCEKCLDVCEEEAISFVKGKPVILRKNCVECGNCISACPVQAVAGIFPKRTVTENKLVITSDHKPTVKELLVLHKKGVNELISENTTTIEPWKHVVDEANVMLKQLEKEPFFITIKALEMEEDRYSRRELFSFWKKESESLMKQVAPAKWRFNHDQLDLAKYYPDYQFTAISVDVSKCSLCKACMFLCSKKCLDITETGFTLTAQTCSYCQLCVDVCPEKAITIEDKIMKVNDVQYPVLNKTCNVCKNSFETLREHDEKCVICTKQEGLGYLSSH